MEIFAKSGVHALVDGQFGSTGKGLYASYLAATAHGLGVKFDATISNAGPNSGHTFYHEGEKHVLKQLPTFAVKMALLGEPSYAFLSAGAIIDVDILRKEAEKYPHVSVMVHPNAAVISPDDREAEQGGSIAAVAGTRSGTGSAVARKVFRERNAVWGEGGHIDRKMPKNVVTKRVESMIAPAHLRYFMEVSQGFSLGLNSEFYPKVTSRECTVMQGIADARIAPRYVTRTFMVARTFPIRVGNVDGFSSGEHYEDQQEVDWATLGVDPELTTVTQRVRRVFTFSRRQYEEAIHANAPDFILMNFMNYLKKDKVVGFADMVKVVAQGIVPDVQLMYGWGPHDSDITPF